VSWMIEVYIFFQTCAFYVELSLFLDITRCLSLRLTAYLLTVPFLDNQEERGVWDRGSTVNIRSDILTGLTKIGFFLYNSPPK